MKYIRSLLSISVLIAFATPLHSQTVTPFTSLPNATSVGGSDILPVVTDPSGDTVAKKVTLTVVHDYIATATETYTGKTLSGNDNNFSNIAQSAITNLATDLSAKAPINNPTFTGTVGGITKSMVGLGNVENTALSTWTGSTSVNTLGTIGTGTWNATPVDGTKIEVQQSIVNDSSGIKLSGDSGAPGNNKVYGTNGSGTKGWYDAASGGGDAFADMAYVDPTSGNDGTGNGSPGSPWATIQKAYDMGKRIVIVGDGNAGGITASAGGSLCILGAGRGLTTIGAITITGHAAEFTLQDLGPSSFTVEGNIILNGGLSGGAGGNAGTLLLIGIHAPSADAVCQGGAGSGASSAGGNSGNLIARDCVFGNVVAPGGQGGDGDGGNPGGGGGNGGAIDLLRCKVTGEVSAVFGAGGADMGAGNGGDGSDGSYTARFSDLGSLGSGGSDVHASMVAGTWTD